MQMVVLVGARSAHKAACAAAAAAAAVTLQVRKVMNALDNERESRATDMLLNYETIKYFCAEEAELSGFDTATRKYQVKIARCGAAVAFGLLTCTLPCTETCCQPLCCMALTLLLAVLSCRVPAIHLVPAGG
jgi:hypothetical protein